MTVTATNVGQVVRCLLLLGVCLLWAVRPVVLAQQPTVSSQAEVARGVQRALQLALAGQRDQQLAIVRQLVQQWPDADGARWQIGQLQQDGRWRSLQSAQRLNNWDVRLAAYLQRRNVVASVEDELELAEWCRRQQLDGHAALHFENVFVHPLSTVQQRQIAADALELETVDGLLLTGAQASDYRQSLSELKSVFNTWLPRIDSWQNQVQEGRGRLVQQVSDEMQTINDPQLAIAVQLAAPRLHPTLARLLVDAMRRLDHSSGSYALAEMAVSVPDSTAARLAIEALQDRPLDEYVPYLLNKLETPLIAQYNVFVDPLGRVRSLQQVVESQRGEDRVLRIERQTRPAPAVTVHTGPGPLPTDAAGNARIELSPDRGTDVINGLLLATDAAVRQRQVNLSNLERQAANERIFDTLEGGTGLLLKRGPDSWQHWWDHRNHLEVDPEDKPARLSYWNVSTGQRTFRPFAPSPFRHTVVDGSTPVWTDLGWTEIGSIQVGDRVLSQDLDTGRLDWQLVRQVVRHPVRQVYPIQVGSDRIEGSPGLAFWQAGTGWRMAADLQESDPLYGLPGVLPVAEQEDRQVELDGFNLVVEPWHTFFIGQQGWLVHDDTERVPTDLLLPALPKHDVGRQ